MTGGAVVRASDHQRPPGQEHARFAQAVLLQPQRWRRIAHADEQSRQREENDERPAQQRQDGEDDEVGEVYDQRRADEAPPRDQPRQHRLGRVQRARIVARIGTDLEVEEVVHQVVGRVRQDDPDRCQQP